MSERLELEPDDRRPHESRRPSSSWQAVRGIALGIAVAALAGGSWWAGHSSGSKSSSIDDVASVPEIHPDTAPVKEVPSNPGGMVVPDQDSKLLNRDAKPKIEELLPPAEVVKQRPVAPTPAAPQQAAPQPSQLAANAPPASIQQMPPAPLPPPINVPAQPQAAIVPPAPPAPSPQAKTAPTSLLPTPLAKPAPTPTPNPTVVAGSGYRLQLGALKTEEAAKEEFVRLQRAQPDVLGKMSLSISKIDLGGGKGIYYRIQAGPLATEGQAAQGCATLKSRGVGCLLIKP